MFSPKFVLWFLISIFIVHNIATGLAIYWIYFWFDIPMHFLGGFWVALVGLVFVFNFQKPIFKEREILGFNLSEKTALVLSAFLIIVSFTALIGVLWEFYEFLWDIFISVKTPAVIMGGDNVDTLKDLFFDLLGGSTCVLIYLILPIKHLMSH